MVSEYKRFRDYELMVVFHPELSEEDLVSESDNVQGYLTAAEATVTHVNREAPWGRRRLADPIRHGGRDLRDGIYTLYYFNAESGRIEEMEREIKLNDRIIRYLLTVQIAPIAEPEAPEGEEVAEAPAESAATEPPTAAEQTAPAEEAPAAEPAGKAESTDAAEAATPEEQAVEPATETSETVTDDPETEPTGS